MHGLILAGGEGSRLAADGVTAPKALAEVGGRPQLVALVAQLVALGCTHVTCLVRDDVLPLPATTARALAPHARTVACRTPSSLHTLVAGLDALPPGDVFCSLVDTVMAPDDWRRVHAAAAHALAGGADAMLALTPPVDDDDAPLWVQRDADGTVVRVGGGPSTPPRITGGVYAFAPAARLRAAETLAAGYERLRAFLGALVDGAARVQSVEVARIIDVDHRRDLDAANAYLATVAATDARLDAASLAPPTCR